MKSTQAVDPKVAALLDSREEERCAAWGKAVRLAQRLSGGTEATLKRTSIGLEEGKVVLDVPQRYAALAGEATEQRLKQLAKALGRAAEIVIV